MSNARNETGAAKAPTFRIVRIYMRKPGRRVTLIRGLSEAAAMAHCKNPESSSSTCTHAAGRNRTRTHGEWFDAFEDDR